MVSWKERFLGDKAFYRMIMAVAIPIIVQNGITNFVNLLDNIMVGQLGTESMSGVSIANQLIMVFNICIFGGMSGAGIFTAQYYGKGDKEGIRNTFRFKWITAIVMIIAGLCILEFAGGELVDLFLNEETATSSTEFTRQESLKYLRVIMIGLVPSAIAQVYISTLRETGETVLPMKAGVTAILVNLVFNYLLIYGSFGFPKLGVVGAATATTLSRFVELAIVVIWMHTHVKKVPYIEGVYRTFRVPVVLVKQIILKGAPLMINEMLWASGFASLTQCYSMRGLDAVAAINIGNTISNLFNVVFLSFGTVIAIVIGSLLGAGKLEEAKRTDVKIIFFIVALCVGIGGVMSLFAPLFPRLYNTSEEVRSLAMQLIWVQAAFMPVMGFTHAAYFTMRSGGKTIITFVFDSVFMWVIAFPVAYVLGHHTAVPLIPMYIICQAVEIIKCVIGAVLIKKGVWVNNIVENM